MRINKYTMQVIKAITAAKTTFKKMAVEYRDNAEMFTTIGALADAAIASEIGD